MSHHNSINANLPQKISLKNLPTPKDNTAISDLPMLDQVTAENPNTDKSLKQKKVKNKFLIPGQGCLVFEIPKKKRRPQKVTVNLRTPFGKKMDRAEKQTGEVQLTLTPTYAELKYRREKSGEWRNFKLENGRIDSEEKYQKNRAKSKVDKKDVDKPIIYPNDQYSIGIDDDPDCIYWISVDSLNKRLIFGKGEMRHKTRLLDFAYDVPKNLFNKTDKRKYDFIDNLTHFETSKGIQPLTLWKDPVVVEPPVLVVRSKDFSMDMAAAGITTTASSLSEECQILYGNVADFELNTPDFPDFAQAIEYSMRTKGCVGNDILRKKLSSNTFGPKKQDDKEVSQTTSSEEAYKEVYLRITLGQSQGESPGIPYVMEIWPSGCASPVHNHGSTHAIIKVLRGSIDVDMFRMLPSKGASGKPFGSATFHPGDVTYLMPEINQFHLLKNKHANTDTCITIQCYSYGKNDDNHHATFDYMENNELGHFDPISDYDFIDFKEKVREEWQEYLDNKFWLSFKAKK